MNDLETLSWIEEGLVQGIVPDLDRLRWLTETLRRSFTERPDDFMFPEYAALVSSISGLSTTDESGRWISALGAPPAPGSSENCAYALRIKKKMDWRATCELGGPRLNPEECAHVFSVMTDCPNTDAFLAVRPYVRAHAETPPAFFEELRRCSISVTFANYPILDHAPIDDYLISPEGKSFRNLPPEFYVPSDARWCRKAVGFGPNHEVHSRFLLGAFLPKSLGVLISLTGPKMSAPVKITCGLVAAHYTSQPYKE